MRFKKGDKALYLKYAWEWAVDGSLLRGTLEKKSPVVINRYCSCDICARSAPGEVMLIGIDEGGLPISAEEKDFETIEDNYEEI